MIVHQGLDRRKKESIVIIWIDFLISSFKEYTPYEHGNYQLVVDTAKMELHRSHSVMFYFTEGGRLEVSLNWSRLTTVLYILKKKNSVYFVCKVCLALRPLVSNF